MIPFEIPQLTGLAAFKKALYQRKKHQSKHTRHQKPEFARFKAMVYFEGRTQPRWFYSWDTVTHEGIQHEDEFRGLEQLLHFLNHETTSPIITCKIWAHQEPEKQTNQKKYNLLIAKFTRSGEFLHPGISFRTIRSGMKAHTFLKFEKISADIDLVRLTEDHYAELLAA